LEVTVLNWSQTRKPTVFNLVRFTMELTYIDRRA
jgi:hypothetical protein